MITYHYLFFCFYQLTGDGSIFYFRVTAGLALGTSFFLSGLFNLLDAVANAQYYFDVNNLWLFAIWLANWLIHLIYFLTGERKEEIIKKYKNEKKRISPKVISVLYLSGTFTFCIWTFWIMKFIR
jgi:hypothetical protein